MAVEIRGIEELTVRLETLASGKKVMGAMGKACGFVEDAAKMLCPEDTTELSRSIKSKVERRGSDVIGTVYTPKDYANYVEYGTGLFAEGGGRTDVPWRYQDAEGEWYTTYGQMPQPFMRPALNDNREFIKRILLEAIADD
jgi:HK97 gp10 family phage protein